MDKLAELAKDSDALVVGCGMGRDDETAEALNQLVLMVEKPLVIDADALKLLDLNLIKESEQEIVVTPHKAEFKSLFGYNVPEHSDNKQETVQKASQMSGATVLLKGAVDIIAYKDKIKLNSTGNPGMTVGGTGDCLAGIVGGLIAQGHPAYEAAFLGAYLNGKAGDLAVIDLGYNFTTTDLMGYVPKAFIK